MAHVGSQAVLDADRLFALVKAIIRKESNFNSNAINKSGKEESVGLMQVNIKAHNVSKEDMLDPVKNINYGTKYLCYQLARYGSVAKAVSAYNAGRAIIGNYLTYVAPVMMYYSQYLDEGITIANKPDIKPSINVPSKKEEGYVDLKFLIILFFGLLILSQLFRR
jgi:hypothetical protein